MQWYESWGRSIPSVKLCEQLWVPPTCGQNVNTDALVVSSGIMGAAFGRAGSSGVEEALWVWLCLSQC